MHKPLYDFIRKAAQQLQPKTHLDIQRLIPMMVPAVQKVYDEWDQNADGYDEEKGHGGICDEIAEAIAGVLSSNGIEVSTISNSIGDQHVYPVAQVADGVYEVDIHPYTYESGGGYTWRKLPGVKFVPQHVKIALIDTDPAKYEELTSDW